MDKDRLLNIASFSQNSLQHPNSWIGHVPFAAWVIKELSPNIFVELGTHTGNSYFAFCTAVSESDLPTKCFAVDTWKGDEHAGSYDEGIFIKVNTHNQDYFAGFSRLLRMTFDEAISYFSNETIDLLHIDGLHTYEAVLHDFENWLPKLAPGAVVLFHDTNVRERNFGVWKLWEELKKRYPDNMEFFHSHGLGVLQLNNAPHYKRLAWLEPKSQEKQHLIQYFSALGLHQLERYEFSLVKTKITEREGEILQLHQALSEREAQIISLNQNLSEREKALSNLTCLTEERIAILSSISWRITSPLRGFKHRLPWMSRQIRRMIKLVWWTITGKVYSRLKEKLTIHRHNKNGMEFITMQGLFDTDWYLSQNPDVAEANINPLQHFLESGWREGRDPSPFFDTDWYLEKNPDVVRANINPLQHFIEFGWKEGRAPTNNYQGWIRQYDSLLDSDKVIFQKALTSFSLNPLISVVMPVYNTPTQWLIKAIESVRNQIYPHWELCISDNASTDPDIRQVLDEYARTDSRIHVIYRESNGHICANSNTALTLAAGEFIALLDSDDELPEHALFWVAHEINQYPDVDLIYSDEDKMDEKGVRHDPYFKPDWNPALMCSQNTFCHLGVYRRTLVDAVGGFRLGFEGSQDWDLVLRCSEKTTSERIRHIPRILYHWRAIPGSTASISGIEAKPYAWVAGKRAIEEHLERMGTPSIAGSALEGGHHQVSYLSKGNFPKVSIVMPSACKLTLLKPCLESLLTRTTYPNFEILLVVNEIRYTVSEQAEFLKGISSDPRVKLLVYVDQPFNYSKINNWAIAQSNSSIICLMNDDIEVITDNWLEKLVIRVQISGVGAVGPLLLYPDNRIQHAGVILGLGGVAGHHLQLLPKGHGGCFGRAALEQDLSCVTAACMVVKRDVFDMVGGFNERLAIAFNDVDLCIRIRTAGWRIIWTPEVELYHHESASIGKHDSPERAELFRCEASLMRTMWGEILDRDPFYNPNLSLDTNHHNLAFPPRISKLPIV